MESCLNISFKVCINIFRFLCSMSLPVHVENSFAFSPCLLFCACTNTHTSLFCWCIKSTSLDKVACSFWYLLYLFPINRSFDWFAVSFWYLFHSFLLRMNFLQIISLHDFVLSFIFILDNFFFSQLSQVWCLCVLNT